MTELSKTDGDSLLPILPSDPIVLPDSASTDAALEIIDFSDEKSVDSSDPAVPPRAGGTPLRNLDPPPNWLVGVGEAMCWWFGTLFVHIAAGAMLAIVLIVIRVIQQNPRPADIADSDSMLFITAGEMILFVLAAMLGVSLRFWNRTFAELNLSRPDPRHLLMVVGGTLPLTLCVSAWSMPIQLGWDAITEAIPALKIIDSMNTMEVVKEMAEKTSFSMMVFVVAILPAIGEELVFRGAIGRALIANMGIVGGVLLTSFLFGWIHIHPVHALAVMPLGLAMHLVYLWSRSFWLPMLLHFLNNCWATIEAQAGVIDPVQTGVSMSLYDGLVMAVALICVIALSVSFWQSRIRLFDTDGREANDPRFPVRVPVAPGVHGRSLPIDVTYWRVGVICMVLCHLLVAYDLLNP